MDVSVSIIYEEALRLDYELNVPHDSIWVIWSIIDNRLLAEKSRPIGIYKVEFWHYDSDGDPWNVSDLTRLTWLRRAARESALIATWLLS